MDHGRRFQILAEVGRGMGGKVLEEILAPFHRPFGRRQGRRKFLPVTGFESPGTAGQPSLTSAVEPSTDLILRSPSEARASRRMGGHRATCVASWFETRLAALLAMRRRLTPAVSSRHPVPGTRSSACAGTGRNATCLAA